MNDKERILVNIIDRLYTTQLFCSGGMGEADFKEKEEKFDIKMVHFECGDDRELKKNDLIMCMTCGVNDWKIGFVEEIITGSECLIREIGSDRACHVSNEKFIRIIGMSHVELLEGDKYIFRSKVIKAFNRGDEYMYRFGGVDFLKNNMVKIWVREAFGAAHNSIPFSVKIEWNKKMSIKKYWKYYTKKVMGQRNLNIKTNRLRK